MSTYSTNLKIELIGTGEQAGTWGVTTDDNFSNVFEQSIVGRVTVPFTDADVTLTATNSVSSQSFRNVYLNCTGTNTASKNLIVPTINKNYVVQNNTTGGFSIVVKTSAGTGITVPNGKTCTVYADGTNVIQAFDYLPTATLGSPLITTSGGTGLSSYTAGDLTYYASGTALSKLAIGTNGYILKSTGSAPTWVDPTTIIGGAGGSNTQVQYNSSGSLAGSANMVFDGSTLTVLNTAYTGTLTGGTGVVNLGSGQLYKDASGLVGIGTSTGGGKLQVAVGTTNISGSAWNNSNFVVGGSSSTSGGFGVSYNDTTGTIIASLLPSTAWKDLTIYSNQAIFCTGGVNERMRIDTSGNVGIGTSGPGARLEVNSNLGTFSATGNSIAILNNPNSNGQSPLDWVINGTLRGRIRTDFVGSMNFVINGGNYSFFTGGDSGVGTEVMRIDYAGNVGIGTSSPAQKLDMYGATAKFSNGSYIGYLGAGTLLVGSGTATDFTLRSDNVLSFGTGGPYERMRIDSSGNVGIGVTTIATPSSSRRGLQVSNSTLGGALYLSSDSTEANNPRVFGAGTTQYDLGLAAGGSTGYINYYTNGTERMRIDSSGNVGIGVTPSAWASGWTALQINGNGLGVYAVANQTGFVQNHYFDGSGWKYTTNNVAARFTVDTGGYSWQAAPTGIAGSTVAFTQVLSQGGVGKTLALEAAGSVNGVGITFPATQSASSDANTLDDYEEGTWTPTMTEATYTYSQRVGTYVKIGSLVYANCFLSFTGFSGATGLTVNMTGLPFAGANGLATYTLQAANIDNLTSDLQQVGFQVVPGGTNATMIGGIGKTGSHFGIPSNDLSVNTNVRVNYIYHTDF